MADIKAFRLDNNTYYPAKNITVAPSSNGVDSGKIYTEYNGRRLTINIVDRNYVIAPNPGGYDVTKQGSGIFIAPGDAEINGFAVYTKEGIAYRLPTRSEIVTNSECWYKDYALLCLHTIFDAQKNINGNEQVNGVWYCTGIIVEYVSYANYKEHPEEYLLLGGVDEEGNIKPNKDKFTRIDAKYIFVQIEGDPETGVPPTQSTDLATFINNFLHGYWVSKAGDNEYGELLFKTQPADYLEEGFDYKTEDPLNSKKFGVKVSKAGGTIVIKPENEASANIVTQIFPAILGFYQGVYKGDTNKVFDARLLYEKLTEYGKVLTARADANTSSTDKGVVKAEVQATDGRPVIAVEHNTKAHNGVDAGNVVYATEDTSKVGHGTDTTTKYGPTVNYLVDKDNDIRTQNTSDTSKYARMSSVKALIEVSSNTGEPKVHILSKSGNPILHIETATGTPTIQLNRTTAGLIGKIILAATNFAKGSNNLAWKNVFEISDNLKVTGVDGGSIYAGGFLYLGDAENPATTEVPDYAHSGGMRKLKKYDVYSKGQVWSAVYNDYAEMFKLDDDLDYKDVVKKLLSVDVENPHNHVLADRHNTAVVGVVSENPAYCCGGDKDKHSVPVALAGRVEVKYEGRKPKIGDYVGLSKKTPGYVTKCKQTNKYRCGKIVNIIDDSTVAIIVLL